MNQDVVCSNCRCQGKRPDGQIVLMQRPMEFVGQWNVQGTPTFAFHCMGCNGKAYLQQARNPQTGDVGYRQVRLTGSDEEYRPSSVRPHERMQIPVAYTVGSSPSMNRTRIPMGSPPTLPVAFSLDPRMGNDTLIKPSNPMHPANIRKRIQPWSLDDLT